jgi:uncharacterized DUF497 family protein
MSFLTLDDQTTLATARVQSRYHTLGETIDGRCLHITFTLRCEGKLIRVTPARHATE